MKYFKTILKNNFNKYKFLCFLADYVLFKIIFPFGITKSRHCKTQIRPWQQYGTKKKLPDSTAMTKFAKKSHKASEKDTVHMSRQHMPFTHGRVYLQGFSEEKRT